MSLIAAEFSCDLTFLEAYLFFTNAINFWSIPYLWNIFKTEVQRRWPNDVKCSRWTFTLREEHFAPWKSALASLRPLNHICSTSPVLVMRERWTLGGTDRKSDHLWNQGWGSAAPGPGSWGEEPRIVSSAHKRWIVGHRGLREVKWAFNWRL